MQRSLRRTAALAVALACVQQAQAQVFVSAPGNLPSGIPFNVRDTEQIDFADIDLDGDLDALLADGSDCCASQNRVWVNQAGLQGKTKLAVGLMFITDIHSLGVDEFQGTQFTDAWYWNFDDQNRQWADKFKEKTNTRPSFAHAGNYSAALQYLEAIQEAGTDDADAVVAKLEGKKVNDVFLRNGEIRAEDHRVLHDAYLAKVKTKDQVKEDWDYQEIVTTIPATEAFGPVSDACTM